MRFSVIIPVYNEAQNIRKCLDSLTKIDYTDKEIIVVDDASTDDTSSIVKEYRDRGIKLIERKVNGGRGEAINEGIQLSTGDIIVTTDGDTQVPPNWLKKYKKHFSNPEIIAVGGSYRALKDDNYVVICNEILDLIFNEVFKKKLNPNMLSGVNSAYRKDVLIKIKSFCKDSWWSEDTDLYLKIKKLGKAIYDPEIYVETLYPTKMIDVWKRKYYWGYAQGLRVVKGMPYSKKIWLRIGVFFVLTIIILWLIISILIFKKIHLVFLISLTFFIFPLTVGMVLISLLIALKRKKIYYLKALGHMTYFLLYRELAYFIGFFSPLISEKRKRFSPTWKKGLS